MDFMCELYEAQTACGRHFVHELTSGVNSRMKCVTRTMAMPGTRTIVAYLCMFGLAACDEEEQDVSTRTCGRSPMHDKLKCGCQKHERARMFMLMQTIQGRKKKKQEHGYITLPKQWKNN